MVAILDGIRVLDFGRYIAAPFCCQLLADMGAEVIRVDRPGGEPDRARGPLARDGQSLYYMALNRNKKAITLDLHKARGREVLAELVKHSDAVVHNQPVGRAEALGLDYPRLRQANPRIVCLAVSGFGSAGPYARYTALDPVVQALVGAATMTGPPGGPPVLSHVPYVDFGTGVYGALAVMLALFHRERSGQGQNIDLSLLSASLSFVGAYGVLAEVALNGVVRHSVGNHFIYAVGDTYSCSDGDVSIACVGEALWHRLCRAIGRPELLTDPSLGDDMKRHERRAVVDQAIGDWTLRRTVAEVSRTLAEAGIPVGAVQSVDQVASHPQVQASEMVANVPQPGLGDVPMAGIAMKFSETPGAIQRGAPAVGEHNREVYDGLLGEGACRRLADEATI